MFSVFNWTFCCNYILKAHDNFPTSSRYLYFATSYWKLTSKSPQAHTFSIYFSQPVTETEHEKVIVRCQHSLGKLLIFVRKDAASYQFSFPAARLLKVNESFQYTFLTEKLLKVHDKSPQHINTLYQEYFFSSKCNKSITVHSKPIEHRFQWLQ